MKISCFEQMAYLYLSLLARISLFDGAEYYQGAMRFCEIIIKTAGEQGAGGMEKELSYKS